MKITLLPDEKFHLSAASIIASAQKEIFITTFKMETAIIPRKRRLEHLYIALENQSNAGIKIKIILNQLTGEKQLSRTNRQSANRLKRAGCEIRTLPGTRIAHAKIIISDNKAIIIGSHNWTLAALTKNFETSILIEDENAVNEGKKQFLNTWIQSNNF